MNRSRREIYNSKDRIDLYDVLETPKHFDQQVYKCRVEYDSEVRNITFEPYTRRLIKSLKVIENDIIYDYKTVNRDVLNRLFLNKSECDDILIVKNGLVTDTSYCNICFWDGNEWFTPMTPLLKGTRRAYYIHKGIVKEKIIKAEEIHKYEKVSLINAMINLEEIEILTSEILF